MNFFALLLLAAWASIMPLPQGIPNRLYPRFAELTHSEGGYLIKLSKPTDTFQAVNLLLGEADANTELETGLCLLKSNEKCGGSVGEGIANVGFHRLHLSISRKGRLV